MYVPCLVDFGFQNLEEKFTDLKYEAFYELEHLGVFVFEELLEFNFRHLTFELLLITFINNYLT